jgi:hypothetical protein
LIEKGKVTAVELWIESRVTFIIHFLLVRLPLFLAVGRMILFVEIFVEILILVFNAGALFLQFLEATLQVLYPLTEST